MNFKEVTNLVQTIINRPVSKSVPACENVHFFLSLFGALRMSDRTVKQTLGPIKVRRKIREKDVDLYDFKHLRQHLEFPGLADNKIKSSNEKLVPLSSVYPIKPNDSWVPWPVFVSLIFRFATGPKAEELKNFLCAEPPRSTPTSSSSALVKQKSKATLGS
jgi:hypothetical protein